MKDRVFVSDAIMNNARYAWMYERYVPAPLFLPWVYLGTFRWFQYCFSRECYTTVTGYSGAVWTIFMCVHNPIVVIVLGIASCETRRGCRVVLFRSF